VEIQSRENGTWKEVPVSSAKTRILPGTWVFSRKRTPDGAIGKYKAQYCVCGDLQETEVDTFAPVSGMEYCTSIFGSIMNMIEMGDMHHQLQQRFSSSPYY
jgi:hypothetical protein